MKLNTPLIGVVILMTLTSGCLGSVQDQGKEAGLIVTTDSNFDRIQTVYEQGELTEQDPGVIQFDFSSSVFIDEILSFGVSPGDGREDIIIDANQVQEIEVTYDKHGYYTVEAFAIDVNGERESTEIIIIIEQEISVDRIEYRESRNTLFRCRSWKRTPISVVFHTEFNR
jgi:hypothetical protein